MHPNALESHLHEMGAETARLEAPDGAAALFCPSGARLVGLWPNPRQPNLLWTNPEPPKHAAGQGHWSSWDTGGVGGDRLWLGPEHRWFFEGTPQADLSNWRLPPQIDPGHYTLQTTAGGVNFAQNVALPDGVTAQVKRTFQVEPAPPQALPDVQTITLRDTRSLQLTNPMPNTQMDLWSIAQVPVGSWLIVPTRTHPTAGVAIEKVAGELFRRVHLADDHFAWQVTGKGELKGFLPVSVLTGCVAVLQQTGANQHSLLIRRFLPSYGGHYADALFADQVGEQCVHWWDGFGFGEIECHSPTLSAHDPAITEQHYLHAWTGPTESIRSLARSWLECELPDTLFRADQFMAQER